MSFKVLNKLIMNTMKFTSRRATHMKMWGFCDYFAPLHTLALPVGLTGAKALQNRVGV
jgi:hypothetical protein